MDGCANWFVEQFKNNFQHLKGRRVAFYGVGHHTKLLLEEQLAFHVVGLMDRHLTGQMIYGKKVLSDDEVIKNVEVIVIVANLSVAPQIYYRIQELVYNSGIEVYYLNGLQPTKYDSAITQDVYWNRSVEELQKEIEKHEVISFDIFDTLLMRKCVQPETVFKILQFEENLSSDFVDKRKEAERICYHHRERFFTIEHIYQVLQESLDYDQERLTSIMAKEIEIEERMILPRGEMIKLFNYALQMGKKVILVSDMYLHKATLEKYLKKHKIENYEKLFISCEEKADKYWGSMWEKVKCNYPDQSILHIGDNEISDYKTVLEHGITPYRIASSKELMHKSGLGNYFGNSSDFGDSMMVGLFAEKTLSNPFALGAWNGKLYIDSMYDFGYLFFGPLILKYLLWLKEEVKTNKIDTILFVARDGYLLEKIYQKVADIDSPTLVYYLSSRRAASIAALENEKDIWFVLDKMCNIVSVKYEKIIKKLFGIEIAISDELFGKTILEIGKEKMFEHTCENYAKHILKNAEKERRNYLKYISGLQLGEKIGFVNFVGRGVTQYWTEKMLQRKMKGFYFAAENDITDIYPDIENISCLYPKFQSLHTSKFNMIAKGLYGETILTAPTGTVICFDQNGEPVFEERNRKQFALISECHKGIEKYVDDMLEQLKKAPKMKFSLEMVDKMFGLFGEENIILSDEIKSVLKFEDYYGNR